MLFRKKVFKGKDQGRMGDRIAELHVPPSFIATVNNGAETRTSASLAHVSHLLNPETQSTIRNCTKLSRDNFSLSLFLSFSRESRLNEWKDPILMELIPHASDLFLQMYNKRWYESNFVLTLVILKLHFSFIVHLCESTKKC